MKQKNESAAKGDGELWTPWSLVLGPIIYLKNKDIIVPMWSVGND